MHRRRFVAGGVSSGLALLAGCMGADEQDASEEESDTTVDHREVRVEAENLTREADNRIVEDGQVTIVLELKNIGTEPEYAAVSLQLRDRAGEPLGSPYTRQHGPIEPEQSVQLRFDVAESDDDIGGYELVVEAGQPE